MAIEGLSPPDGLRIDRAGPALDPELERRIAELEDPANQGRGWGAADWAWLALLGVVLPVALLVWGWPG